jgi:hypothetical protein
MARVWNKGLHIYTRNGLVMEAVNNCICRICSKPFHAKKSQIDRGRGKHCSKECCLKSRSQWMKDKSKNPFCKQDFTGDRNGNWKGGNNCLGCNKKVSRFVTRCAKCNYEFHSGENHHHWIPNKIRLYPLEWKSTFKWQIRHRDGYKCQLCGVPQSECKYYLSIHHIDYKKENTRPENLVSLCNSCHAKTNFNRDYWQQYFTKEVVSNAYA